MKKVFAVLFITLLFACGIAEPTPAPLVASVGQSVNVDGITWRVNDVSFEPELVSDNQFIDTKTTSGRFVRLTYELTNNGADAVTFTGIDLTDNQGRSFGSYSEGFMFVDDSLRCIIEQVNPGITRSCQSIYEVPQDSTGLKAVVTNLKAVFREQALVELGQ